MRRLLAAAALAGALLAAAGLASAESQDRYIELENGAKVNFYCLTERTVVEGKMNGMDVTLDLMSLDSCVVNQDGTTEAVHRSGERYLLTEARIYAPEVEDDARHMLHYKVYDPAGGGLERASIAASEVRRVSFPARGPLPEPAN
jgi:hypothetical protein